MKFTERIVGNNGYLMPMYNEKVIVHYPLFANTYLLPYFYSKLFEQEDSGLLKNSNWGNTVYKEIIEVIDKEKQEETGGKIHLFYSRELSSDLKKEILLEYTSPELQAKSSTSKPENITLTSISNGSKYYLKRVDFCRYFPRFLFFDFSVDIFQKLYGSDNVSKYNAIANFLTEHFLNIIPVFDIKNNAVSTFLKDNGIKKIQIFSDTPDEAQRLSVLVYKDLRSIGNNDVTITVINNETLSNLNTLNCEKTFNIYFYSAPYNILFLKKKYQYLPFQLQSPSGFQDFDTACYLISHKEFDTDNKLKNGLDSFFRYIFWKARETPEHFYKITQSFNFISAVKQPFVIFENEYCFAKCLSLFINPEDIEKDFRDKKDEENSISKRLIFESLFNNSHSEDYEKRKKKLLDNVKQIYTLIALNYLIDNIEKIHLFRTKSFSSVCEALQNTIFNIGFYNKVFELFIKYQVEQFIEYSIMETANKISNPIDEAINRHQIRKEKICQRLIFEIKYHFNQVLIKECQAEDVFLTTNKNIFVLEELLKPTSHLENYEQKAAFKHLQEIFTSTLTKSAVYYDDIVALDHLGLASIFRTNTVKTLLLSKITMSPSIYVRKGIIHNGDYYGK
ncbi:hypothetical protein FACS189474_3210 [Bacteroidia bacterium]|nr:hypothetical protein FACS189474_3210 [Bacteroidia bacterium]